MAALEKMNVLPYVLLDDGITAIMSIPVAITYTLIEDLQGHFAIVQFRKGEHPNSKRTILAYVAIHFNDHSLSIMGYLNINRLMPMLETILFTGHWLATRIKPIPDYISYFEKLGFVCAGTKGRYIIMKYYRRGHLDSATALMRCLTVNERNIQSLNIKISAEELNKFKAYLTLPDEHGGGFRIRKYDDNGTAILVFPDSSVIVGDPDSVILPDETFGVHTHPLTKIPFAYVNSGWPSGTDLFQAVAHFVEPKANDKLCSFVIAKQGVWLYQIHEEFQRLYKDCAGTAILKYVKNKLETIIDRIDRDSLKLSEEDESDVFLAQINSFRTDHRTCHVFRKPTPIFRTSLVTWEQINKRGHLSFEVKYAINEVSTAYVSPNYYSESIKDIQRPQTRVYQIAEDFINQPEEWYLDCVRELDSD